MNMQPPISAAILLSLRQLLYLHPSDQAVSVEQ